MLFGVATQSPNPILPSTGEIIWSVISFAILLLLLVKYAFPPVAQMMNKRSEKIRGDLEAAEVARTEAEATLLARRQELDNARQEGQRIIEDARATADALGEQIVQEARREGEALREQAQAQIEAERSRLVLELRSDLASMAVELSSRILAQELSNMDVDPLVEAFISEAGQER